MFEVFDTRNGTTIKWCRTLKKAKAVTNLPFMDFVFCDVRDPKLSDWSGW